MSTDFTFNADTTDESTPSKTIDCANAESESTVSMNRGEVTVDISDAYLDYLVRLAEARESSGSGLPESNQHYDNSIQDDVNVSALGGEGGLHVAYDEWDLDEEIYENGGDGGLDGELVLGGETLQCDVKTPTSQYSGDPWLKVKVDKIQRERRRGGVEADAFILASYDDGEVTYHGWIATEELCQPENKSRKTGVHNYLITNTDELNPMPNPTNEHRIEDDTDATGQTSVFSFQS
jgi:hypothetical protein